MSSESDRRPRVARDHVDHRPAPERGLTDLMTEVVVRTAERRSSTHFAQVQPLPEQKQFADEEDTETRELRGSSTTTPTHRRSEARL